MISGTGLERPDGAQRKCYGDAPVAEGSSSLNSVSKKRLRYKCLRELSHLLSQSEAFQGDVLAHQGSGVWELYIEVSRVFPVVT